MVQAPASARRRGAQLPGCQSRVPPHRPTRAAPGHVRAATRARPAGLRRKGRVRRARSRSSTWRSLVDLPEFLVEQTAQAPQLIGVDASLGDEVGEESLGGPAEEFLDEA